ncbi:MAG TPA: hypothetical protein VK420_23210 [Longimicrobium sp.]|nr:hypothetical protein [Longimicrobium sp.]
MQIRPVARAALAVLTLAVLAACSGDDEPKQSAPAPAEDQEMVLEVPQPQLTPAESTAVMEKRAAYSDSITRAVRGVETKPVPHRETKQDQLALCRTQASQAEGTIREHLLAACKRLEAQPSAPAPASGPGGSE